MARYCRRSLLASVIVDGQIVSACHGNFKASGAINMKAGATSGQCVAAPSLSDMPPRLGQRQEIENCHYQYATSKLGRLAELLHRRSPTPRRAKSARRPPRYQALILRDNMTKIPGHGSCALEAKPARTHACYLAQRVDAHFPSASSSPLTIGATRLTR